MSAYQLFAVIWPHVRGPGDRACRTPRREAGPVGRPHGARPWIAASQPGPAVVDGWGGRVGLVAG